ncbi:MAG: cytochrome c oxidase assembly protein [Hyphomicrobiaceae bacterium]|nr:cytochrome c oxidase assembly protein [Hyphomicrobiaceae bacterium]
MTEPGIGAGLETRHRRVAVWCAAIAAGMLGLAYAAVPLYSLFCQVTGYAGTTQRAGKPSDTVLDRAVTIRFDANVAPGLGWSFRPVQRTIDVRIGENTLAFYRAENTSGLAITGTATFNVTPEIAGSYFNKLECFCFQEQRLEPGQSIEMPVSFFVDPAIVDDKSAGRLSQITLSYTFYPVEEARAVAARPGPAPAAAAGAGGKGS